MNVDIRAGVNVSIFITYMNRSRLFDLSRSFRLFLQYFNNSSSIWTIQV